LELDPMPKETLHLVQAFIAGRGGRGLRSEAPIACKSADEACRRAERLASVRLGVVAFTASADAELGDYDENPLILFKAGQLAPPFDEL
jgi:hypothetical protein